MTDAWGEFDIRGELPSGVTLLEASAGTGKTYTVAALAARYVAEGTPLDRLLVVSFTRNATLELRERVRDRFVTAAEALSSSAGDDLVRLLATGDETAVSLRQRRLARAVANFDAATIETTDGFCRLILSGLGTDGDVEPNGAFVPDLRDLLEEVVDDLFVRRFWRSETEPAFDRAEALTIARAVLDNPSATILPTLSDAATPEAMRRRFAEAVRAEMERRKRASNIFTYSDVLTRLDETLADPTRGAAAGRRLASRYDVVLVDEFQDTDPVQWDILRRAFVSAGVTVVLIGDPKQAIYAFRGADVYAYLDAGTVATTKATLGVNWRSDQRLIDAYDGLFANAQLGQTGIAYRRVRAAPPNVEPRFSRGAALRVRILDRRHVPLTSTGAPSAPPARTLIAGDLAADIGALLVSGTPVGDRGPVTAGDIAVLVRYNSHALVMRDALQAAGIPAVVGGAGSVFATSPADDWLRLLRAVDRPTARDRVASAALTPFVGWTAEQVAGATDEEWEALHWRIRDWASILRGSGVAALVEHVGVAEQLPARLLARPAGERLLTDIRHIGELLHATSVTDNLGTAALAAWLRKRVDEAAKERGDTSEEDRARRLDSDADAVQIMTIHRSKGLEFPIVYCPTLWDARSRPPDLPMFHDPGAGYTRTIDVARGGADFSAHEERALEEERGEELRLLYVALTRARHQAVVWWVSSFDSKRSPLGRVLLATGEDGIVAGEVSGKMTEARVRDRLGSIAGVSVEEAGRGVTSTLDAPADGSTTLSVSRFDRVLDGEWRRTSYSAITARAQDWHRVGSEHEPAEEGRTVLDDETGFQAVPGGAAVGTLVHRALQEVDFTAPDRAAMMRRALEAEQRRRWVDVGDVDVLVAGLERAMGAPLVEGVRLGDIRRSDRVDELEFELPLAGGDAPVGVVSLRDLARVLRSHLDPSHEVYAYADRLEDPSLEPSFRGYLTGSLDLVFRTPGGAFVVADYKTNRLPDYGPEHLAAEMSGSHYILQGLLYTVALHRYLRWRQPGYATDRHLGGLLYLFVRGMNESGSGVWVWHPPASLVEAVSDLFDRGAA